MPFVAPDPLTAARTALGLRVRAARVSQGFTQEQVALSAGCGRQQIIRIETGVDDVYLTTLMNVFHVLGMRLDMRSLNDLPDVAPPMESLSLPRAARGKPAWHFPVHHNPTTPTPPVRDEFGGDEEGDEPVVRRARSSGAVDRGSIVERLGFDAADDEVADEDGPGSAFST